MKQFIFRHEKALTRIFSVIHILLQIFGLVLILLITVKGMYGVLNNINIPINSGTASFFVGLFCEIWAGISIAFFFCSVFLDKNRTNFILEFTISAIVGFLAEIFLICFIFSTENSDDTFVTFVTFSVLYVTSLIMQRQNKKFIARARRKQMRRCLQCFKMILNQSRL